MKHVRLQAYVLGLAILACVSLALVIQTCIARHGVTSLQLMLYADQPERLRIALRMIELGYGGDHAACSDA